MDLSFLWVIGLIALAILTVNLVAQRSVRGRRDEQTIDRYRHSDDALAENLRERLRLQGLTKNIQVSVEFGQVTLSGRVGSDAERFLAEEVAESDPFVRHVKNEIMVEAPKTAS